ncbi:hypothetical protein [Methanoculleus chikugoensis]|uniref:hypothetical protein n=1 Tax=Methanoculleus chikugoensis TaxID=118126 RepID=UPI001FB34CA4|nr:hypothetical protein [Methanoculleus chikugoensis]
MCSTARPPGRLPAGPSPPIRHEERGHRTVVAFRRQSEASARRVKRRRIQKRSPLKPRKVKRPPLRIKRTAGPTPPPGGVPARPRRYRAGSTTDFHQKPRFDIYVF